MSYVQGLPITSCTHIQSRHGVLTVLLLFNIILLWLPALASARPLAH